MHEFEGRLQRAAAAADGRDGDAAHPGGRSPRGGRQRGGLRRRHQDAAVEAARAAAAARRAAASAVPAHLRPVDVARVAVEADVLRGARFAVINAGRPGAPPSEAARARAEASELVARLGGAVIAAPTKDVRAQGLCLGRIWTLH